MSLIGREGKDKLTGFRGIITGRCEYISGCNQLLIQPKAKETGEFVDGRWLDEQRVEILNPLNSPVTLENKDTPGFDVAPPVR